MQLPGSENANNMRNAKCAGTQTSIDWPYCSFLYCDQSVTYVCIFYLIETIDKSDLAHALATGLRFLPFLMKYV